MKFPRLKELTISRAVVLFTIGLGAPMMLGAILFPFFNYIFILLSIGWIPYSVWLALCYYYKRKDQLEED